MRQMQKAMLVPLPITVTYKIISLYRTLDKAEQGMISLTDFAGWIGAHFSSPEKSMSFAAVKEFLPFKLVLL